MAADRGSELVGIGKLQQARLMAKAGVEKKLLKEFEEKTRERVFGKKKGLVDRPAAKTITRGLHKSVGWIAGIALERVLGERSEKVYEQIEPYIGKNSTVLDIGCGDGKIGYIISLEKNSEVELLDVKDYNKTPLPLEIYDGTVIPRQSNSFDHVLLLTVLHHTDDPVTVMKQALRVAKKNVIVIESVYFEKIPFHKGVNKTLDWFYSRVLNDPEINVPFNFLTPTAWVAIFEKLGGNVTRIEYLGLDQPLVPEYHALYVVEKQG